jgi:type IV secretion system protein VirB6
MPCSSAALPAFLVTALTGLDNRYVAMVNDAVFVCSVREYLIDDMLIGTYRELVAAKLGIALAYMSTLLMTIWVIYQGFMIISGANRQPILGLAFKTGKMVLILSLVALVVANSPVIADTVLDFQALVTAIVVDEGTDVYRTIDINLALAQVFNALIDGFVGGAQANAEGKSLTQMAGLVGQSGPAMLVSVMAIMAEISITLAIMLAPLFLFFLMFQQTAAMFWSWAKFLLGTMFSLAVLALVSGILLKMMMMYGATVLAGCPGQCGVGGCGWQCHADGHARSAVDCAAGDDPAVDHAVLQLRGIVCRRRHDGGHGRGGGRRRCGGAGPCHGWAAAAGWWCRSIVWQHGRRAPGVLPWRVGCRK